MGLESAPAGRRAMTAGRALVGVPVAAVIAVGIRTVVAAGIAAGRAPSGTIAVDEPAEFCDVAAALPAFAEAKTGVAAPAAGRVPPGVAGNGAD